MLESSHLFANHVEGIAPLANYTINGKEYNMGYYLAEMGTLVQTIHNPCDAKKKLFAMKQEACRKNVERAFGVMRSL